MILICFKGIKDREVDKLCLHPGARYLKLMQTHPAVVQHVSLKHIASYLGIRQDSLSRIRKRINKKLWQLSAIAVFYTVLLNRKILSSAALAEMKTNFKIVPARIVNIGWDLKYGSTAIMPDMAAMFRWWAWRPMRFIFRRRRLPLFYTKTWVVVPINHSLKTF